MCRFGIDFGLFLGEFGAICLILFGLPRFRRAQKLANDGRNLLLAKVKQSKNFLNKDFY